MEKKKIIFMDGFDMVTDFEDHTKKIFSTILPEDLQPLVNRIKMPEEVIDKVVGLYNQTDLFKLYEYLLDEGLISEDEREIIIESIYEFENN